MPFESEPRQDLEAALKAAYRAAVLASRLLQFTRAQEEANLAADISDTVVATKLLLRPIIGENIRSIANAREGLPDARVNETSIRQALLNLCIKDGVASRAGRFYDLGRLFAMAD